MAAAPSLISSPPITTDETMGTSDIPPAYYVDIDLPPPPPHDPHYTEWPREEMPSNSAYEPSPKWLVPAIVCLITFIIISHVLLAVLLAMSQKG